MAVEIQVSNIISFPIKQSWNSSLRIDDQTKILKDSKIDLPQAGCTATLKWEPKEWYMINNVYLSSILLSTAV